MTNFSTKMFLWFIHLSIFVLMLASSAYTIADNSTIIRPQNSFIPDENFFDKEGKKVFLDQFEGKTILVMFWASWCGSCVEELPSLDALQKDFRKLPFEVVAISEDFKGIDVAEEHFNKYGIRHLKLYHDYQNSLFNSMSVIGLPTAFLIDPEGKIKVIFKGNTKWHEESIRSILLSEIRGNPEIPKNSYATISLNKTIVPIKKELEKNVNEKKASVENVDQSNEMKNDTTEVKNSGQTDENKKE